VTSNETARKLRATGYLAALLIAIFPLVDMAISAWPFVVHQPAWRNAFVMTFAATSVTLLLGLFIFLAVSVASGDRVATLIASSICAVLTVLALIAMVTYTLDWIQLRPLVNPKLGQRFSVVAGWTLLRLALVGISFAVTSIAAFRTTRRIGRDAAAATANPSSMLVGAKAGSTPQPKAPRPVASAGD